MLQKLFYSIFLIILIFSCYPLETYSVQAAQGNNDKVSDWLREQPQGDQDPPLNNNEELINEDDGAEAAPEFDSTITWFDYIKMIVALAFVIGLIYFILKFVNKRNRLYNQMKSLDNIGGIALGTNRSIQLVRVGDRILIVGVGETIQLLKEIDSKEEVDKLLRSSEQATIINQTAPVLNKLFNRKSEAHNNEKEGNFHSLLKQQLDDLSEGRKQLYNDYNKKDDHE